MYRLRLALSADREPLREIHHDAFREHVSEIWGWDENLQDHMWDEYFVGADLEVIEIGDSSVGYLDVSRQPDAWFIANIALAPDVQRKGIGSDILRRLITETTAAGIALTLEVLKPNNSARNLYERLGFYCTGETETHFAMKYRGDAESSSGNPVTSDLD